MYLRFSLRLEIESDRDKISLDCFPSLRTINMYPMLFMKRERHHVSQTTTLGVISARLGLANGLDGPVAY